MGNLPEIKSILSYLIIYMKNKIAKSNGILYKIRNFLDRKTLTHLYNSFVLPYLVYGIEV